VLAMDGGISISEDPNIRFSYLPNGAARFRVEAVDTDGHVFKGEWPVEAADVTVRACSACDWVGAGLSHAARRLCSLSPLALRAFTPVFDGLWRGSG